VVCVKVAEPIEIPFGGGVTHVGPRKHVLDGYQGCTNLFAAVKGDDVDAAFQQNS